MCLCLYFRFACKKQILKLNYSAQTAAKQKKGRKNKENKNRIIKKITLPDFNICKFGETKGALNTKRIILRGVLRCTMMIFTIRFCVLNVIQSKYCGSFGSYLYNACRRCFVKPISTIFFRFMVVHTAHNTLFLFS